MASVTFGVKKKGVYQLCDNKEVLHEISVFLGKIWNGCRSCRNCKICTDILLPLKNYEGSVLEQPLAYFLLKSRKLSEGNYFINHVS